VTIHRTELGDMTWWWLSRRYRTERGAVAAFNRLQAVGKQRHGELDLGIYRHGEEGSPVDTVTVVSHRPEGMEVADRELALGEDVAQHPLTVEALIVRRARVLAELEEEHAQPGSYLIRRGRPARVSPEDGTWEEWAGEG